MDSDSSGSHTQLAKAWNAFQLGDAAEARDIINGVLRYAPEDAGAHVALGMMASTAGDPVVAIAHMRDALRYQPRFSPAIEWLASLYLEVGELAQAEKYALRALITRPDSITCLKVRGQCEAERKEYERAVATYAQVIRLAPDDFDAHFARGTAFRRLRRLGEALAELQDAVRVAPHLDALVELAEVQIELGMVGDAVESANQALEVAPYSYRGNIALARALLSQHKHEEAKPYWAEAEALESTPGATQLELAGAFALTGMFESARQAVEQAIDANPDSGSAYYFYVASKRITSEDRPIVDEIENLLRSNRLPDEELVHLYFALGKAYDNLGEYEKAIQSFDQANRLNRHIEFGDRAFDQEEFRSRIDRQITAFTSDALSAEGEGTEDLPIFVLGMMRSGTTLVDQILSCHPEVGSAGEQGIWAYDRDATIDYRTGRIDVAAATQARRGYLQVLQRLAPGFRFVVDKDPANVLSAGLIHGLFPSSRIICTRRHAIDTAMSIWMTHTRTAAAFANDRNAIVFAYRQILRLMDHWREAMPAGRYLEVLYEALVEEPHAQTHKMLEFCGLDWDERCLHPERNPHPIRTPSFWQARQPVYRSSIDRWKNYEPWLGPFAELIDP